MKTAQKWAEEFTVHQELSIRSTESYHRLVAMLQRAQLDAWKQGMTDAKDLAELHDNDNSDISVLIEIRRDATNSL